MMNQTLPSLSDMRLPGTDQFGAATVPRRTSAAGRLSVAETRELTECANGEHVSRDALLDGIDALLQLKRASYDRGMDSGPEGNSWGEGGELRTAPEQSPASRFVAPTTNGRWIERGVKNESSDDEEDEQEVDDTSSCREMSIPKTEEKRRRGRTTATRVAPPPKAPIKPPPANRPPTIWHPRKSDLAVSFPTPESPKSRASADEASDVDNETTGPATLHFSCLQCHKAKKRCNRTRPCNRCVSRGMESECQYPDKHDPRSVLRACLRCWQTKKKCDRKQPSCGKCDKVGVKCVYRRENHSENPGSPVQIIQAPTPDPTMSPPPLSRSSRLSSDASNQSSAASSEGNLNKRKATDEHPDVPNAKRVSDAENHAYSTRRRDARSGTLRMEPPVNAEAMDNSTITALTDSQQKRALRPRK